MIERDGAARALTFERPAGLEHHYLLSPFVVADADGYRMLVRVVPRSDDPERKISHAHLARSRDGLHFVLDAEPLLEPSPTGPDDAGTEDPTLVRAGDGWSIFYSGYAWETKRSSLLRAVAAGDDLRGRVRKHGFAFDDARFPNPKEPAFLAHAGGYRMYFEFAEDGASHIGVADASGLAGTWRPRTGPLAPRPDRFDAFHLSPASTIRLRDGRYVLVYNGSRAQLSWRIGWAVVDADGASVHARSADALIGPGTVAAGDTDIAFAASTVVVAPERVWLYYSISDRICMRAELNVAGAIGDGSVPPG